MKRRALASSGRPRLCWPAYAWVLVAAIALFACGDEAAGEGAPAPAERQTPVSAMEVQARDLSRDLAVSARAEAKATIRLASRAAGVIRAIHVEEGDRVARGQWLARLDTAEQEAELARARAEVQAAESRYERASQLRGRQVVSEADYDEARRALDVARSEETLWSTRVSFGRVTAPRAAVVSRRFVEPGEAVEVRDPLFELMGMDDLIVRIGVSELDVLHIERDQAVTVRFDALDGDEMEAAVRRIAPAADPDTRLISVEVALPEDAASRGVRPGFLGRVELPVEALDAALVVPSEAVGQDGEARYVYVIDDERLHRREVALGVTRGPLSVVESGLEEGEIVLASNPIDMRDGQRVRIVGWRSP